MQTAINEHDLVQKVARMSPFLGDYLSLVCPLTDAPRMLHLWVALGTLAGTIGKRVSYLSWGGRLRYTNLYILLITPSGYFRKSTAIGFGRNLMEAADKTLVLPNEFSMQRLLAVLDDQSAGTFFINEIGHLYSMLDRTYLQGGRELFCQFWDNACKC